MKTRLLALMLLAGGALFAQTRVVVGVGIGRPGPVVVSAYRPPCPGPGYVWIDGYYNQFGAWNAGYWDVPPYVGAYWIGPRFVGGHFYAGYWGGPRRVYAPGPRFVAPPYGRGYGYGRPFVAPGPGRYERGYYDRGHGGGHGEYHGGHRR